MPQTKNHRKSSAQDRHGSRHDDFLTDPLAWWAASAHGHSGGERAREEQNGQQPGFEHLLSSYQKNMETIRQAQQTATDLVKDLVHLNNQYMRHSFDDLCQCTRGYVQSTQGGAEVSPGLFSETVRSSFDRSIAHCKQITELFSRSTSRVFDCYKKRFEESLRDTPGNPHA